MAQQDAEMVSQLREKLIYSDGEISFYKQGTLFYKILILLFSFFFFLTLFWSVTSAKMHLFERRKSPEVVFTTIPSPPPVVHKSRKFGNSDIGELHTTTLRWKRDGWLFVMLSDLGRDVHMRCNCIKALLVTAYIFYFKKMYVVNSREAPDYKSALSWSSPKKCIVQQC